MSNQINIDFTPCETAPENGYRVRYRPQAGGPLLTWPLRFFDTPAVLDDGGAEPDGTLYQGFLDADCGPDGFGDVVAWATPEESASASASASASVSASASASVPLPPCVPVEFVEGSVPDGVQGDAYSVDLHLTGDAPFTLGSVTKPSWMTVTLVGSTVELRGTPDTTGAGEVLTIDVGNCDSTGSDTFSDTLDVILPSPGMGTMNVQECATEASITEVRWNGVDVITETGTFPVNPGDTTIVGVPAMGTHTLAVTGDFPIGNSVTVQDSAGNISCQNGAGFGTLNFPSFVIGETFWTVQVSCGTCE